MPIVAVAGDKGGIGKTTLAYELAAALDAVLVDLDWSGGGATGSWGSLPSRRHFLLGAGRLGVRHARYRPALIPNHPDLEFVESDTQLAHIYRLHELGTAVIDTHPGLNSLTIGAVALARLVVVPVVLREKELNALEAMLAAGLADRPLLLVPNMVPPITPARQLRRLEAMLGPYPEIPVGPAISLHPQWPRRRLRAALVLVAKTGWAARARDEILAVAAAVSERIG